MRPQQAVKVIAETDTIQKALDALKQLLLFEDIRPLFFKGFNSLAELCTIDTGATMGTNIVFALKPTTRFLDFLRTYRTRLSHDMLIE